MTVPVATSKLTKRNQTTLPTAVRTALGLSGGDELGYIIEGTDVRLVNASASREHEDPVVAGILGLIAADIQENPGRVELFPDALLRRIQAVTSDVEIDHEAPIDGVTAL